VSVVVPHTEGVEMNVQATQSNRGQLAALRTFAVLIALAVMATVIPVAEARDKHGPRSSTTDPVVTVDGGLVRGIAVSGGGLEFRGLPYAAAPTGERRWRPPAPPIAWQGVRDATQFGASCPQKESLPPSGRSSRSSTRPGTPTSRRPEFAFDKAKPG
jgi:para-nitrobenzyl esterase